MIGLSRNSSDCSVRALSASTCSHPERSTKTSRLGNKVLQCDYSFRRWPTPPRPPGGVTGRCREWPGPTGCSGQTDARSRSGLRCACAPTTAHSLKRSPGRSAFNRQSACLHASTRHVDIRKHWIVENDGALGGRTDMPEVLLRLLKRSRAEASSRRDLMAAARAVQIFKQGARRIGKPPSARRLRRSERHEPIRRLRRKSRNERYFTLDLMTP
jgi:hypothetical protein